jgi:hypothetical protein
MPELVLPLLSFTHLTTRPLERPAVTRKLALFLRPGETLHPAARQLLDVIRLDDEPSDNRLMPLA